VVLLEIAAQGVPGFAPAGGRLALRPGYNVVAADGPALRRLLEALWYPESAVAGAPRPAPGPGAPIARAGLTLVGDDGVTWRVVRDLAGGAQLQRFDPERRAFQGASPDPARIAVTLRQAGVPTPGRLASLLSLSASDLPSRRSPGGLPGGLPPQRRALPPEEARQRLAGLASELEQARATERLQDRLDGLQSRLFKLEELLRDGEQIRERLRAAEQAAAPPPGEEAVAALSDPGARIVAFGRSVARRDEALQKIAAELETLGAAEERGRPAPPWREREFLLGLAVAAAAVAVALLTGLRPVALLAIPASGLSAFLAMRWVGQDEEAARGERRRRVLQERERKARETCEREVADVRAAMKAMDVGSATELGEALGRRVQARIAAAEARERLAEWEASPETRQAAAEKARLEEEIGGVDGQLSAESGGYVRDPRSIEAEMARIEADLRSPEAPAVPAVPAPPAGDPLKALVERGAAEMSGTPGEALRAAQPRVGQLLPAISAQRFSGLLVDERGNLLVQGGGRTVPAATLTPADRDLCYVALKVGFLEQALAAAKAVAVLDDAFGGLAEPARRALARLLKQLGRAGQIVHATTDPVFREAADHAA